MVQRRAESTSATKELANFCVGLNYQDIPSQVVNNAKRLLLDSISVTIGGARLDSSAPVIELVRELGGPKESTIPLRGEKVPALNAALVNGTMAHGLELDDISNEASSHPGSVIIPSALAIAEREGASGKQLIEAIVAGYEVMIRVGRAVNPAAHYAHGFHPTATTGVFGAAAAAGKILGLDELHMAWAFGIAGSTASGLMEFLSDGSWTKRLHPGLAARNGILSALLAKNGFRGPTSILEGRSGFLRSYSDHPNVEITLEGLSHNFEISKVSIKPHACCRYKQSAIDAVISLARKHDINPNNVYEIEVGLVGTAMPIVCEPAEVKYNPKSIVDAQFSMPYGAAVALIRRRASIEEYSEDMLRDKGVFSLMKKVKVIHKSELDQHFPRYWPSEVKIRMTDGRIFEERVMVAKGDPENPLTDEELKEKLQTTSGWAFSSGQLDAIASTVLDVDKLTKMRDLTELLSASVLQVTK